MILARLRCRFSGHPMPGKLGEFCAPIRDAQPRLDLPYLTASCPRCDVALRLHFIPGTRGMNTPAQALAMLHWQTARDEAKDQGQ